jgi:hypothetical protein
VQAVIDAKTRDPDEIEKRQNNAVRRGLKVLIGVLALLAITGGLVGAALGGNLIVVALALLIGAVGVAMLGPLASGESVSAADVVQIIEATGNLMPKSGAKPPETNGNKRKRR